MECTKDLLEELSGLADLTGIDYVYVHENQLELDVYFHGKEALLVGINVGDISIFETQSESRDSAIEVEQRVWMNGGTVLRVTVENPGGFANYTLQIAHSNLHLLLNSYSFSFKANCPSDLDCKSETQSCPEETKNDFPIDYQARDFWSYRQALLDFASVRHPNWQDRLESDTGIMLVEVLSALGDEFSYIQDRYAREAYLETATQRRSLRQHARLVDYEIHNGLSASTWIDLNTSADVVINAGTNVWALSDKVDSKGKQLEILFELGLGLAEVVAGIQYPLVERLNALFPYCWDKDQTCLAVGTTELYVSGHIKTEFDALMITGEDGINYKKVLLITRQENPGIKNRAILVDIIETEEPTIPPATEAITRLRWRSEQALEVGLDIEALEVHVNILPATAGKTESAQFVTGLDLESSALLLKVPDSAARGQVARAIERVGVNDVTTYRYSLPGSDLDALCWQGGSPQNSQPEISLSKASWNGDEWVGTSDFWDYRQSLLGVNSSQETDLHFTLEDGTWRRVVGYRRDGQEVVHEDYVYDKGFTIRFGDNIFGKVPSEGELFHVQFRLGNGIQSNVSAGSITNIQEGIPAVITLTNPFAVENGQELESNTDIKEFAPIAWQYETYRAVREEDYAEAAERLEWVQQAGAKSLWTGSWQSLFVSADPYGANSLSVSQEHELALQMDRFRQAGREVYPQEPEYADIDLKIWLCVESFAYSAEVQQRVMDVLFSERNGSAYFSADNFSFGSPLLRSQLEATISRVEGARAVIRIKIRRRGYFDWKLLTGPYFPSNENEIIRIENDLDYPEHGTLRLYMEGGA